MQGLDKETVEDENSEDGRPGHGFLGYRDWIEGNE